MTGRDLDSFTKREMLRHTVATLSYRGAKATRDAPGNFGSFRIGEGTRTPLEILAHIGDLLEWALSLAQGHERWPKPSTRSWEEETERFFGGLAALDAQLASDDKLGASPEEIFQGPIADSLTHVGQIAMLRRIADAPVRGENYYLAEIKAGRVGREQALPRREFD
jgi:hypothetical protein